MAIKFLALAILSLIHGGRCGPALTLQDLEIADDTQSVGSYIREVRAAAPQNYHHSYENDGDGEIGYSRKKQGGGKKGYQHFDSYHKKAGDNYEFEKQDSFGHDDEDKAGAYSHNHEIKDKPRKPRRSDEGYEEYSVAKDVHDDVERVARGDKPKDKEEIREESPNDEGTAEAEGHDIRDYTLPEKYTYGEGDEYNF